VTSRSDRHRDRSKTDHDMPVFLASFGMLDGDWPKLLTQRKESA